LLLVFVSQSTVEPQAIAALVIRTSALLERARRLPVAATVNHQLAWQFRSLCGPASVANVNRSLGDFADTEGKVLSGTGLWWTDIASSASSSMNLPPSHEGIPSAASPSSARPHLEVEDLVLLLDVTRDFEPWLVERPAFSRPSTPSTATRSADCALSSAFVSCKRSDRRACARETGGRAI
jgi:hypothetical protein